MDAIWNKDQPPPSLLRDEFSFWTGCVGSESSNWRVCMKHFCCDQAFIPRMCVHVKVAIVTTINIQAFARRQEIFLFSHKAALLFSASLPQIKTTISVSYPFETTKECKICPAALLHSHSIHLPSGKSNSYMNISLWKNGQREKYNIKYSSKSNRLRRPVVVVPENLGREGDCFFFFVTGYCTLKKLKFCCFALWAKLKLA